MKKRDTSIGVPPDNLTADLPAAAQPAAPSGKRSPPRFTSKRDQRATTSPVNVETNYSILLGQFITAITYLEYELVLTGAGLSAANMPSDRPAMPPAKSSNVAPFMSMGDQRATAGSVDVETNDGAFGEFWSRRLYMYFTDEHAF